MDAFKEWLDRGAPSDDLAGDGARWEFKTIGADSDKTFRHRISFGFMWVEDAVYISLGILLTASALVLLVSASMAFAQSVLSWSMPGAIIALLDQILLILMTVEILYTVHVSYREHMLAPEPFLLVGLIAATRRILVITAEFPSMMELGESTVRHAMYELALLTLLIIVLVTSLFLLRKQKIVSPRSA